jgi:pyruvate/2-oxoacid:ferredoxin oxidoreductase beta subunit
MTQNLIQMPSDELMEPGHLACPGCGAALTMRWVLKGLGRKTILVVPACCWSVIDGAEPLSAVKVPMLHTAFETAACTAAGVKAGMVMRGDTETNVVAWAGDGGTFDIGLQALSAVAERNEDIIYVCYDNEAYMNTGIQRSSATPMGTWTTTTPAGDLKRECKKDIVGILAAHRVPYIATAALSHPEDLLRKVNRARHARGFRFLHILSPCPPGWKTENSETIKISRAAVNSRVFPLLEIEDGIRYQLMDVPNPIPVSEYISMQGRFRFLDEAAIHEIQHQVDAHWRRLEHLCALPA